MQDASAPTPSVKSHWPISILSALSSAVNMALPLVLVRLLDPREIGLFRIFFLYLSIVPSFSLMAGLNNGLSYWAGQGAKGLQAVRASSLLNLLSGAALGGCAWLVRARLGAFLGWQQSYVLVFCLGLFSTTTSSFYEEASIATGRIWRGAVFGAALDLLRTGAILVTALRTHDLGAVFLAYVGVHLFKSALGFALALRQGLARVFWDRRVLKPVWDYAFPVSVSAVFWSVINYSDQLIVSKMVSASDFAFYSVGCLTVPPLLILEASVNRVLIPRLAETFAGGRPGEGAALYRHAVRELAYLAIPAVTGMIVFAGPIVELLFTRSYASAAGYLRVYAIYYLAVAIPNDAVPRARGEARWILWSYVFFSLLTLVLCLGLAMAWGPYGALGGLLLARFATRGYGAYYAGHSASWRLGEFLPLGSIAQSLTVCVGLAIVCWLARPAFGSGLGWFLVMGGGFAAAYFAITLGWAKLTGGEAFAVRGL